MVIAQRLVRVLCSHCVEPVPLSPLVEKLLSETQFVRRDILKNVKQNYKARGCSFCRRTGYRGRIGIFEILDVDEAIRSAVVSKASAEEMWKIAMKKGAKTMLEDGLLKVLSKQTSLEEVFRVISA